MSSVPALNHKTDRIILYERRSRQGQKRLQEDYPSWQEDGSNLSDSIGSLHRWREQPQNTNPTVAEWAPYWFSQSHGGMRTTVIIWFVIPAGELLWAKRSLYWGDRHELSCSGKARADGSLPEHTDRHHFTHYIVTVSWPFSPNSETFILNNN